MSHNITLKSLLDDSRTLFSTLNAKILGFSLTFTWSFLVFYGSFWSDGVHYIANGAMVFAFACCTGNIVGYIVTRFMNERHNCLDKVTFVNVAIVVASFVGMLLSVFSFVVSHAFQAALIAFGGVLTGLTTSWITVMWGYFFVSLTLPQRTLCSLGSLVVGGVLYLVILTLPEWAQMASACLLLPSSWALAIICNAGRCPSRKESADSYTRLKSETRHSVFAMFLFGIFFWICRVIKMADSAPSHLDTISFIAVYLAILILAAVIIVVSKKQVSAEVIFRFALPAAMLGVIVIFCLGSQYANAGFSLFMSAYALMDIFLFLVLCNASRRTRCNPIKGICYGRLAESLSMPLGMFLGLVFLKLNMAVDESTLALGIVFFLVVSIGAIGSQDASRIDDPTEGDIAESGIPNVSGALEFAQKCRLAIERYGLSPREAEVMLLITRGRSVPYISDHLYMARSTTKAHITSIYRKMDVRDRQEMIDFIESIPIE